MEFQEVPSIWPSLVIAITLTVFFAYIVSLYFKATTSIEKEKPKKKPQDESLYYFKLRKGPPINTYCIDHMNLRDLGKEKIIRINKANCKVCKTRKV